jgi:hypothetical protein
MTVPRCLSGESLPAACFGTTSRLEENGFVPTPTAPARLEPFLLGGVATPASEIPKRYAAGLEMLCPGAALSQTGPSNPQPAITSNRCANNLPG